MSISEIKFPACFIYNSVLFESCEIGSEARLVGSRWVRGLRLADKGALAILRHINLEGKMRRVFFGPRLDPALAVAVVVSSVAVFFDQLHVIGLTK